MTLVAPDVCRYSINGDYLNRPAVNVLDMVVQPEDGSIVGRQDAIEITSRVILNAWVDNVMTRFGSSYSLQSISWVDLNSDTGSVGITTSTPAHTLPLNAGGTGEPLTAALAMLVTKVTTRSRGSRPGRWFLPGFVEQDIVGNIWVGTTLSNTNAALSTFLEEVTETGLTELVKYFPTVVHTRNTGTPSNPNIVYVNNTQITDLQANGRVSTQRQRNRP
jgi:hypothetical protein